MGYNTDFFGLFRVTPKLSDIHRDYLNAFSDTRRVIRDPSALKNYPDPLRKAVNLPIGVEGGYYVGCQNHKMSDDGDPSLLDYNNHPEGQHSLWCNWCPTEDGSAIIWNGAENFYCYVEWLEYLIEHFIEPWGYTLNGRMRWEGRYMDDTGIITINQNKIEVLGSIRVCSGENIRPLNVFLCYAKEDINKVRYVQRQLEDSYVNAWMDKTHLLPGQDWQMEIQRSLEKSDVIIICLSKNSVKKTGFSQKEINLTLDIAGMQPEGNIFIIPLRLDRCDVPRRLAQWQYLDRFDKNYDVKLREALLLKAKELSDDGDNDIENY